MRRLRDAGIVTMLLLGLTGCAGVQQRLGWTEPPYRGGEGSDEERPLSRLAFWRRHRAEETTPEASAPEVAAPGRSTMIAGSGMTPADDAEGRPGLLRRLPLVGRLWKADDRAESDPIDVAVSRYAPPPANAGAAASLPPRPTGGAPASPTPVADATPAPAAAPAPAPATAAVQPDRSEAGPVRELSLDLSGMKPQVDAEAVPAGLPGPPADPEMPPPLNPAPESASPPRSVADAAPQEAGTPPPPVVPSRIPSSATPTATPAAQPEAAPDLSPVTSRGPALPSPTIGAGDAPASGSWTPTVTSTPGPVWSITPQPTYFSGSGQTVVSTSSQGNYVSGGCEPTCGPKCKVHKLCPFKKHKQTVYASSQYSPAPSGQCGSSCGGTCKVKKPCFLKTWLHHKSGCKSKGCKGCKSCTYCGETATMVSEQGPIVSSQY